MVIAMAIPIAMEMMFSVDILDSDQRQRVIQSFNSIQRESEIQRERERECVIQRLISIQRERERVIQRLKFDSERKSDSEILRERERECVSLQTL